MAPFTPGEKRRALIVDDEAVFRTLLAQAVTDFGFEVETVDGVDNAKDLLEEFDPDIVLLDLALGGGRTGFELLELIESHYNWIAVMILTTYRSPELVASLQAPLRREVGYVVKSDVVDIDVLAQAIESTLASRPPRQKFIPGLTTITRSQAEVLRLMAEGLSNGAIAEARGCTPRALERISARLYAGLGLNTDPGSNPRVQAVNMYRTGHISVY